MPPKTTYTIIKTPTPVIAYPERDTEEKLHQLASSDHLGREIKDGDEHCGECGGRTDRPGGRPESEDVTHCELAGVSAGFGHDQEHCNVCNQPTHRIHEPIIPVERDEPRYPEERGRGHVIPGDGPPVLGPGDSATGRIEIRRSFGPFCRPEHDYKVINTIMMNIVIVIGLVRLNLGGVAAFAEAGLSHYCC